MSARQVEAAARAVAALNESSETVLADLRTFIDHARPFFATASAPPALLASLQALGESLHSLTVIGAECGRALTALGEARR